MTGAVRPDRNALLGTVDLDQMLEDLAQDRGLERRGRQFPCPSLDHQQSGRTPPASTAVAPEGYGVWHCHGCGAGGTAVDALIASGRARDLAEAFRELEAGFLGRAVSRRDGVSRAPATPTAQQIEEARPDLDEYVGSCAGRLWTPAGADARNWLSGRGLAEREIQAHRLGLDPGRRAVPRPPHRLPAPLGPAITIPALTGDRTAVYVQARQLDPCARAKYLNPCSAWIGPSPRLAQVALVSQVDDDLLLVTEGILDAIIAGRCFASCAVMGVGQPDDRLAGELVRCAAGRRIAVCFDADAAGRAGAARLVRLLRRAGASRVGSIDLGRGDLNDLLIRSHGQFEPTLRMLVARASSDRSLSIEP